MTIYCIGRNYVLHAKELSNEVPSSPVVFLKSEGSLRTFVQAPIAFPQDVFHYEGEFVLEIGKDFNLGEEGSLGDIVHLYLGIDLTRREEQNQLKAKGLPWTTAKSFLGSAILGKPYLFRDLIRKINIEDLFFEFRVLGDLKQVGYYKKMIFDFKTIIDYLNSFSPLKKGDLIFTGTPEGVGPLKQGDTFEMKLMGLDEYKESGIL